MRPFPANDEKCSTAEMLKRKHHLPLRQRRGCSWPLLHELYQHRTVLLCVFLSVWHAFLWSAETGRTMMKRTSKQVCPLSAVGSCRISPKSINILTHICTQSRKQLYCCIYADAARDAATRPTRNCTVTRQSRGESLGTLT